MYGSWILILIILISSLPVIAVYIWFRLAKYEFTLVRFLITLLAGAFALFPALVLQDLLNISFSAGGRPASAQWELFYHVFFRIAFTEELCRLLVLFIYFFISKYFIKENSDNENSNASISWNDIKKGAAVGLVAGLGFAILESAVYAASDTRVLLLRAVTAAPLHAACGSRIGIAAIMFRSNPIQALFRLFAATAIHGIYNFMVTMPGIPSIAAVLVAFSALASSILTIRGKWNTEEN